MCVGELGCVCLCVLQERFAVLSRVVREGRKGLITKGICVQIERGEGINLLET